MSLSRWIRDYLFFPLLGKRATLGAMCRAALVAMTLCGVWHGAGWPFVLWGFYHGILISGYHVLTYHRRAQESASPQSAVASLLKRLTAMVITFALVSLGWVLFRSASISQALGLVERALTPWAHSYRALSGTFYLQVALLTLAVWLAPLAGRWAVAVAGRAQEKRGAVGLVFGLAQGGLVGAMVALALVYLRGQNAFIYFQF
jgi:D-alanyl-lipoteichoic acid acyltransferase DltB (MBOAT superfamily)